MSSKRSFHWLVISVFIVFCGGMQGRTQDHPNIVVMLVDDMGVMDTSVPFLTDELGRPKRFPLNDYYRTPHMERLASQGIRFNNFYSMSVCSPTRIALMTGQNAARHRTTNWINPDRDNAGPQGPKEWNWQGLKPGDTTLAGVLRSQGYRTIHVGKGHFGPRNSPGADPRNLGFDINVGGASIGAPTSYYGEENYGNAGGKRTKAAPAAVPGLDKYHGSNTFLTEALTLEANSHVADAVQANKPFFLYFAQYAVHGPFNSDPRFAPNYVNSGKPPAAQAFATLIEGMDKSLGDVLDNLVRLGVAENTLVFFVGDNGSDAPLGRQHEVACAAPLRGKKGAHYEGGMRVPFIAGWAKPADENKNQARWAIARGAIQNQQAAVFDLFPTILEIVGTKPPVDYKVDGINLANLMMGKSDRSRSETFLMHYPHSPHRTDYFTVLRDGEWKVIYHYFPTEVSGNSHYQLYNLKTDPYEQHDLASAQTTVLREMMGKLVAALADHQAVLPIDQQNQPAIPLVP